MAAPTTSYKSEKLPVIKGNSSGGIATQNDIYIAKFLQNTTPPSGDDWGDGYFNSTDTEAQKLAKIKNIFKIDGLCLVAKGAADGSAAETGFVGYCNSRNSGNGLYHKTERFSGLKIPIGASGGGAASTGELLNDAGLNTKPYCRIVQGDANQVWWANLYSVKMNLRSAYYFATTKHGFEYKINSGDWKTGLIHTTTTGVKTADTFEFRKNDSLANQGDTIYLRAIAFNDEGWRTDDVIYSHALADEVVQVLALKVTNINDTTGTSTEIYMTKADFDLIASLTTSSQSLGIEGFTSDLMNTEIANGYYKYLDAGNPNRVFTYSGEFTKYDNATTTDAEGLPTGMPRLYKNFITLSTDYTFATGVITDASIYPTVIQISPTTTTIGANVRITGVETGEGLGSPRTADIYLRRVNSTNPSLNEDVFVKTINIEPFLQYDDYFSATLTKGGATDNDKFTFIEL